MIRFLIAVVLTAVVWPAAPAWAQSLRGRVLDPQERVVASAEVLVLDARSARVVTTTRTRPDGTFGPVTLAPGDYWLLSAVDGLRSTRPSVTIAGDRETTFDIKLVTTAVNESLVVSAAHVDSALSRVADSVTVIDSGQLEARQVETVGDALRTVPGFGVIASGGRGAIASFFPRGGESDYTLVLVDGIPQNAFGGGFDAAHLSTAGVERIEVVRGPQSALFGSGAIGGLVHVITRQGGPTAVRGLVELGGYGTRHGSASASGSMRAWTWGGTFDGVSTDGDTRERANLQRRVANDDYRHTALSGSLGWSDRADRRLRFHARAGDTEKGFPGAVGSDPLSRFGGLDLISRGETKTRQVGASAVFGSPRALRHHGAFTWTDLQGSFVSASFFDPTVADPPTLDRSRRITARYQADVERSRLGVSGGVEAVRERADNTFVTDNTFTQQVPIRRSVVGVFGEVRPVLGSRASLTAGVRVERIGRLAMTGDGFSRPTFDTDDVVVSVNPKVSAAWFVREPDARGWTKLRGGAGTGIKPPTTFELGFTNNPGLKPERSRSLDVGIEHAFARSAVVADVTAFANSYDDLIVTVRTGSPIAGASQFSSDNVANARARGVEAGASYRSPFGLVVRGAWTWLDSEVLAVDGVAGQTAAPFTVGDALHRRPRHQGSLEISWSGRRAAVFGLVNGRGRTRDLEPNFGSPVIDNPGYATTTLGGSFRMTRGVDIVGRVTNLFDKAYEEALGFPALGRSAMLGLRVAAGR